MNAREAMEVFKQNSWNVENFVDPGDAMLYGDSKNSNCDSKFMDYLETLKSDNEEDNEVIEGIMTGYNAYMNDIGEFVASLGAEPKRPLPSRLKSIDERLNDTKRKIEDIRDSISLITDIEREHVRRAREEATAAYCNRYPFMLTDNDEEEDVKKEPKEMTLLEKLSQRSDAGLLADKFTNFLKTNSLQK